MIQCPICEHENPEGAQICASCGSELSAPDAIAGGDGAYTPFLPKNVRLQNNKYAVGEVLGQGGFGITYKGGDMALKRYVAIKEFFPQGSIRHNSTIRPDRTLSPADYNSVKAKFIDEAHRLARFSHPSIVRVFGVFEENNTAYMVMEFLEGQSLLQRITEKRSLNENEVVDIANKIGDALAAVHAAGLIHRDIKPDNIMLTSDGRVVLIDFGTARSFASNKTVKQTAMLTPGYAPLEQYGQQARFGAYTDIYALGATLYHALTGELPAPATDLASGVELKAPNTINPNISQGVSNAILWAMKVKADERPQSVKAFLDELEKTAPVAPPQSPQQNAPTWPTSSPVHPVPRTPLPVENLKNKGGSFKKPAFLVASGLFLLLVSAWIYNSLPSERHYIAQGAKYQANYQYQLSIDSYNKALEYNPRNAMIYMWRGISYSKSGDDNAAITDYNTSISIDPNIDKAYFNRGISYDNKGYYSAAIADYTKAISINPNNAGAYNNRGVSYYHKGQGGLAVADWNKAISIDPNGESGQLARDSLQKFSN